MSEVQLMSFPTREAWLSARTESIGASEAAALFNASRFDSELSLWTRKRGIVEDDREESERMEVGLLIEPSIAALYQKRTARQLWAPPTPWTIARHPRLPFMTASVDRWVIEAAEREGRGVLELKNVDGFLADDWQDEPPLSYQIQFQMQLAVTGFRWGSVAGLVGGNRFKSFDIERNDEFIAELEARCTEFWGQVQRGEMPAVDGSEHTRKALKRLNPRDNGLTTTLGNVHAGWWDEFQKAKADEKAAKAKADDLENKLKAAIGANTFGLLPDGRLLSLKTTSRKGYTSTTAPTTFRTLKSEKKGD